MKTSVLLAPLILLCPILALAQGTGAGKVDLTFTQSSSFGLRPNSGVNAIVVLTNGQVIIGGGFSQPLNSWGLARLNTDGTPDATFDSDLQANNPFGAPGWVGQATRILQRSDGKFYVFGDFDYVAYRSGYTNLALFDASGNHETNFMPNGLAVTATASRLAVTPDNKLLLNTDSNLVHRLNDDGAIEASFELAGAVDIQSLATSPDGGIFAVTSVTGSIPPPVTIKRFLSDGTLDTNFTAPTFSGPQGGVFALGIPLVQQNGKPIVLGYYTHIDGVQRGGIARLNTNGTVDSTFVPGANGIGGIYQGNLIGFENLAQLPDGNFIITRSGPFRYNGTYRNGVGRISSGGTLDTTFDPAKGPAANSFSSSPDGWGINATAIGPNGEIYVGGVFTNFNKTGFRYIVRLNAGAASATPTIVSAPESQSVSNGVDVTFTVAASGPGPFTYSWKHNGKTITGATSATLTATNVDLGDVGAYIVTVANSAGSSAAAPAILTVNGVSVPDFTKPGFKVTSPAGTFVLATTPDFTFSGTAADNQGLASLNYKQDSNAWVTATLTSNWTFNVTLTPGTNIFLVTASDNSGNYAATQRVVAFYSVTQALSLTIVGNGTVAGATNGQGFAIGRHYPLKATQAPGNLFSNWMADGLEYTNTTLNYFMWSNATVQANFITNPFIALQGNYSGLFYETNAPAHESSGAFNFKLTSAGAYSGKLIVAGVAYSGSGQFDLSLHSQKVISRKAPLTPLTVDLQLVAGTDQVIGTVSDGSWTSELFGYRGTFTSASPATNLAGKYTWLVSAIDDPAAGSMGQGYSTVAISLVGAVQFKGALAENTAFSYKSTIASNGQCAIYQPLYKNAGSIVGWITFAETETNDIHGPLLWTKPAALTGSLYSGGFTGQVESLGSRYATPASGTRILDMTNGVALLQDGNLANPSTNQVTLDAANKIAVTSTNLQKLALKVTTASGLIGGSFTHPATAKSSAIKGVVLQKQNAAGGFFTGTNSTGGFYFGLPTDFPLFD